MERLNKTIRATSETTTNVWGYDVDTVSLWRVALDPEIENINKTGIFRLPPGYGEAKYFSDTSELAASFAKQAYSRWPQDGPYTMLKTAIPRDFITPEMKVTVDRGISTIVIPEELLPYLNPPIVLDNMPITGLLN
jgi:hypothetical protein